MSRIKIAVLSSNHGHARGYFGLKDEPLFELVGVSVKPGYENVVGLEKLPDSMKYRTDEELYAAHPEIEAVVIGSDNKSHMRQMREAVKRGLHIFSMKIPTFDMDEYREMVEITEKAGIVCQVELEMRYHASLCRIRELIESGALGELQSINMVNYSHNPVWWRPWQCDPEDSYGKVVPLRDGESRCRGGALADHPHIWDAIRYVTGAHYDTIFAEISPNPRPTVKTEDMIHAIGRLDNGALFSVDPSYANDEHHVPVQIDWEKYPRCVEVFMSAVGSKAAVVADLYGKAYYSQRGKDTEYMSNIIGMADLWNRFMQDFYDSVRFGARPRVTLRDHYETICAMNAAYESVTLGRPVKLTLPPL